MAIGVGEDGGFWQVARAAHFHAGFRGMELSACKPVAVEGLGKVLTDAGAG